MTASPDYVNAAFLRLSQAFDWAARVWEEREARARLAALSELERHDLGGERPVGTAAIEETLDERRARLQAIRAWHRSATRAA